MWWPIPMFLLPIFLIMDIQNRTQIWLPNLKFSPSIYGLKNWTPILPPTVVYDIPPLLGSILIECFLKQDILQQVSFLHILSYSFLSGAQPKNWRNEKMMMKKVFLTLWPLSGSICDLAGQRGQGPSKPCQIFKYLDMKGEYIWSKESLKETDLKTQSTLKWNGT